MVDKVTLPPTRFDTLQDEMDLLEDAVRDLRVQVRQMKDEMIEMKNCLDCKLKNFWHLQVFFI